MPTDALKLNTVQSNATNSAGPGIKMTTCLDFESEPRFLLFYGQLWKSLLAHSFSLLIATGGCTFSCLVDYALAEFLNELSYFGKIYQSELNHIVPKTILSHSNS